MEDSHKQVEVVETAVCTVTVKYGDKAVVSVCILIAMHYLHRVNNTGIHICVVLDCDFAIFSRTLRFLNVYARTILRRVLQYL